jgi:hypothetical protein
MKTFKRNGVMYEIADINEYGSTHACRKCIFADNCNTKGFSCPTGIGEYIKSIVPQVPQNGPKPIVITITITIQ